MSDYVFAVADYTATGEGRTVYIMISDPWVHKDEWLETPDKDNAFPGVPLSIEERAKKRMAEFAGEYMASGLRVFDRADFLEIYGNYLPPTLKNDLENDSINYYLSFKTMIHKNYS